MWWIATGLALVWLKVASETMISEALAQIKHAKTVSVNYTAMIEEFPRNQHCKLTYRKGGFLRMDDGRTVYVANPSASWQYFAKDKTYRSLPVLPKDFSIFQILGLSEVLEWNLPILSGPTATTWHGMHTLRIELDGRKAMTKETKLFVFLHPTTHLPLGVSANLGSMTQVRLFDKLKLNSELESHSFVFAPPRDWKRQKP